MVATVTTPKFHIIKTNNVYGPSNNGWFYFKSEEKGIMIHPNRISMYTVCTICDKKKLRVSWYYYPDDNKANAIEIVWYAQYDLALSVLNHFYKARSVCRLTDKECVVHDDYIEFEHNDKTYKIKYEDIIDRPTYVSKFGYVYIRYNQSEDISDEKKDRCVAFDWTKENEKKKALQLYRTICHHIESNYEYDMKDDE